MILFHDLRYSVRALTRQPLFTLSAVCSLGLGIGACVVIYSVVYALLLKPLPYARPEQLVHVGLGNPSIGTDYFGGLAAVTVADILSRPDTGFTAFGGEFYFYGNLTGIPAPTQVTGGLVTEQYLDVFGVRPALGRLFLKSDFQPGAPPAVVLGDPLWRTQCHADASLLGHTVLLDDKPRVVVGVMPASFKEPNNVSDLWTPLQSDDPTATSPTIRSMVPLGRVKNSRGAALPQIQATLDTVSANLAAAYPADYKGWRMRVEPLGGNVLMERAQQHALWLLLGGVGCVLLVTCANVASLQLVRASARRRELGVRLALGASRARVMRQSLTESGVLAALGGGLGLLLAAWGLDAVRALLPKGFSPRQDEIALDLSVLGFAAAVAALAGVAAGALPAWFASRQDPAGALTEGGRGAAGGAGGGRTRGLLVVAEISLALVLLAGAGLLGRSFFSLLRASPGLRTERVLTLGASLSDARYPDAPKSAEFYRRVLESVRAVPGVENVGMTSTQFFNWTMNFNFLKLGQAADDPAALRQTADYDAVNPECFAALDIPLLRGRRFDARDNAAAPSVVIVNEEFARRFLPPAGPLGQKIVLSLRRQAVTMEVVGVTANVRRHGAQEDVAPQMYVPYLQRPPAFATFFVRAAGSLSAESLTRPVQAAIWKIDPDLPISSVSTLAYDLQGTTSSTRLYLALFALFAGLTLGLAALGIYGTVSYSVGQRRREIGIRLALGAPRADVLRLVLGQGTRLILAGLGLGILASLGLARLVASLLYGVDARDPLTLVLGAVVLGLVALLASYLPARRATRIDPLIALREE